MKNNNSVQQKAIGSIVSILLFLSAAGQAAAAEEGRTVHPWLTSKYGFDLGLFWPYRRQRLSADGSLELDPIPDEVIDFGSELKLSQSDSTFSAEFTWHYGVRWSLLMQYFDSTGTGTAVLEEDIEWEDLTFLAGTQATAGSGFELTRFFWGYRMSRNPHSDYGVGAGFHWLHISAFIEGTIETPSGPTSGRESTSVDAPLPNIGIWYIRSLSPQWAFRTRLDYFSADIHPYDGYFINASAGFNFQISDRLGIGASYNYIELDVGVSGHNWRGELETRYAGLYAYLSVVW